MHDRTNDRSLAGLVPANATPEEITASLTKAFVENQLPLAVSRRPRDPHRQWDAVTRAIQQFVTLLPEPASLAEPRARGLFSCILQRRMSDEIRAEARLDRRSREIDVEDVDPTRDQTELSVPVWQHPDGAAESSERFDRLLTLVGRLCSQPAEGSRERASYTLLYEMLLEGEDWILDRLRERAGGRGISPQAIESARKRLRKSLLHHIQCDPDLVELLHEAA